MKATASHDKKINMRNIKKHASPYKLTYESLFFKFLGFKGEFYHGIWNTMLRTLCNELFW